MPCERHGVGFSLTGAREDCCVSGIYEIVGLDICLHDFRHYSSPLVGSLGRSRFEKCWVAWLFCGGPSCDVLAGGLCFEMARLRFLAD